MSYTCTACVAGKYKAASGSMGCSDCSAGTYLVTVGATAAGACVACPVNSYSGAVGVSVPDACKCNTGYTGPDGGICSACLAGSFKAQTGSAACGLCANDTFSAEVGRNSSCVPCQANAVSASGSASQAFCYCKSGYAHAVGMSTVCRQCDQGTYNSQLGRTACSNCSVGLYSVNYGAIGSETCLPCPIGQWSPEGSPNCNLCPANSRAAAGSGLLTSCVCDAGYTGAAGSTCASCLAGTYKAATGSASCTACPTLTSTSGSAVTLSDCWCVTGYIKVSGVCATMVPRAVAVVGSLAGVSVSSGASYIENATQALRASLALRLNISIDLVQIERLSPLTTDVRVSIFGRSETELNIIEGQVRLATTVPTAVSLPFTVVTGSYTSTSVLAAPRAVVIAGSILNISTTAKRRLLLESTGVFASALSVLRLEISRLYNVSLSAVRLSFDGLYIDNKFPVNVTIDAGSELELRTLRNVSIMLKARGSFVFGNFAFLINGTQDAGPCGLNFTSTLVRADAVPMTLVEMQSSLSVLRTQQSLYFGVPESAVDVTVVQVDGVYSVQTVVRAVQAVTVETLQQKFVQASPSLTVASVTLALPFQMKNVDVSYMSVPAGSGVSMPNAVSIQSELVYADGTPLSSSEVAQAGDTLILQMSRFYGVDTSLVTVEIIPPRNPAVSNASSVRVVILSGVQTVDDVFQRAEQMPATAAVQVVPVAIAGLNNAQTTVLQGQMVAGQFVECPANYRVYNATCRCAPGYMLQSDLSTCSACAAGKYSAGVASTACTNCPANTFSANASTACTACQANSVSSAASVSVDACACIAGYFFFLTLLEKRTCLPCALGTFKGAVGNDNCTACWTGSSLSVGGSSEQACCPAQSVTRQETNAYGALYERQRPKFHYSGSHWDAVNRRFLDVSGNGRHSLSGSTCDGYQNEIATPYVAVNTRGLVQADISGVSPYTAVTVPAVTCPDGSCTMHMYSVWECPSQTVWNETGTCTVLDTTIGDNGYGLYVPDETCGPKADRLSGGRVKTQQREFSLRGWNPGLAEWPKWSMCYVARILPLFNPDSGQFDWFDISFMTSSSGGSFGINMQQIRTYVYGWVVYPVEHDNTQWTVFCIKSEPGADPSKQGLLNGVGVAGNPRVIPYDHALMIGNSWTSTPWHLAQVLVWDVLLSDADMQAVSDHLLAHVRGGQRVASGCGTAAAEFCGDVRCICTAGYAGPADGPCAACGVGKYKNTTSKDACAECAAGSFSDVNGSTGCAPCPANTFFGSTGARSCTSCPNLTQSAAGSNASSACACVPGYTGAGGLVPCTACGAGSFKSAAGSAACSSCPARSFSGVVGATSIAACTACHPNATSSAGSPSQGYCYCEAGFAQVNGTAWCALCNPGKYNAQLAGTACSNCTVGLYAAGYGSKGVDSCFLCPAGQWSPEGSPDCKMCPVNGAAPARSGSLANCRCNPGFTGPNEGACVACVAGTYKPANGSAACTSCPANANSAVGSTNVSACSCNSGYTGPDVGPCVACAAGTANSISGSATCSMCPANTYAASAASACTACPARFLALPGTTAVEDCCGLNSSPQNTTICTIIPQDPLSIILATSPAYLVASAEAWDTVNSRFTDLSGNGRHGALTGGTVSVGSVTGNGAGLSIPFVGGTVPTIIRWPTASIPSTFTICSITRYTGGAQQEIFNAGDSWKHGHYNGYAGSIYYGGWNSVIEATFFYTISVKTNWVIACGRNIATPGAISTIVNGVVTSTALGGNVGTGSLAINGATYSASDWQLSRVYVWNTHLSNADFADASAKLNSYVAGVRTTSCVPAIGCSCNTGYTGPDTGASKGNCTTCPAGTYKPTNGSAACTSCTANANSAVGSTNVSGCSCNSGYTGPDVGPCVACVAGTYKNVSGSAACGVCPANTYSASVASVCTACAAGFTSAPGSIEAADCCDPNTAYVKNLYYSLSSATRAAVDLQMYNVRVSSAPMLGNRAGLPPPSGSAPTFALSDGYNGQGFLRFSKTSPTSGHSYMDANEGTWSTTNGLTIVCVMRFMELKRGAIWSMQRQDEWIGFELYMSSAAQFCVNAYSSNICTDTAVPINVWLQVTYTYNPSATNKQLLQVVYTSTGNTVVLSKTDTRSIDGFGGRKYALGYSTDTTYSNYFGDLAIKGDPDGDRPNFDLAGFYFIQTLASAADIVVLFQAIADASPIAYDKSTSCPCNAGFGGTGRSDCSSCAAGTYKSVVKSASCSPCVANTYSTAVQATSLGACVSCPSNSEAGTGSTGCLCSFGYTGEMTSCVACVAGKYKRVIGTTACIGCPANTVAVGAATTVCSSVAGFSGLGYALDDVARSCGSALSGTCATLANGATTNAVGAADGALDANVNTFVSVAFNPNLARSCGSKGTAACAASISPVFSGASVVNGGANDGDTNTQAGSDYELARTPYIRPYWGVDFGQTKSVVAVKILTTSVAWGYLKDFKIVVGNVSDAQSPLNAVCANYLTGSGTSYVTFTCEDTVRGRYLYIVNGPHAQNYLTMSEVVVESFNYTANPALMLPWWAVDFEVERAVAGVVIQTQAATTVQVRVGASADPLQNAVCASGAIVAGVNNTLTCAAAMPGRYVAVVGPGNSVLVLNEIRVAGAAAAQCAAGSYKPGGNTACTPCPALSTSVAGATSVSQCSCSAPYF
jgi:hypothetical protein